MISILYKSKVIHFPESSKSTLGYWWFFLPRNKTTGLRNLSGAEVKNTQNYTCVFIFPHVSIIWRFINSRDSLLPAFYFNLRIIYLLAFLMDLSYMFSSIFLTWIHFIKTQKEISNKNYYHFGHCRLPEVSSGTAFWKVDLFSLSGATTHFSPDCSVYSTSNFFCCPVIERSCF